MAKFLNTSATTYYLEELIKNARERLYLISPYLKLNDRMTICPECGNRHQLDKAGFEAAVAEGEKQIDDLHAKVRSIGENLFKGGK